MDYSRIDVKAMYLLNVLKSDLGKLYVFRLHGCSRFSPINSDISDHLCKAHAFVTCHKADCEERWPKLIKYLDIVLNRYEECYRDENTGDMSSGLKDAFDFSKEYYEKEICNNGK